MSKLGDYITLFVILHLHSDKNGHNILYKKYQNSMIILNICMIMSVNLPTGHFNNARKTSDQNF